MFIDVENLDGEKFTINTDKIYFIQKMEPGWGYVSFSPDYPEHLAIGRNSTDEFFELTESSVDSLLTIVKGNN
tara:strand:- start:1399 stop:1617 length:219 start_codon:yes stop_codon:yes gene_type:complete